MCRGIPNLFKKGRKLSGILHDDISIFYCCRRYKFTVKALLHNIQFFFVKERKLNIYNALIKSSLLYGAETWRLTENNKRRVEATEMDALRRSSRISRKDRIRNVTIRQHIGLEETIIKEIE